MSEIEYCVQYTATDGSWHEWSGSRGHFMIAMEYWLHDLREKEFDPTVSYRIAKREVTEWEGIE